MESRNKNYNALQAQESLNTPDKQRESTQFGSKTRPNKNGSDVVSEGGIQIKAYKIWNDNSKNLLKWKNIIGN